MSDKLRQIIWHALDMDMLDGAEFASERLLALDPSNPESKHLYGLVLYRQRRYKAACNVTNNTHHVGCAYIYARSCLHLKNYEEGIQALEQTRVLWGSSTTGNSPQNVENRMVLPDHAAVSTLLGRLCEKTRDKQRAVKAYGHATRSNPYLWESVEALCAMGVNLIVDNIFKPSTGMSSDPFTGPSTGSSSISVISNSTIKPTGNQMQPTYAFKTSRQFVKYGGRASEEDAFGTPTTSSAVDSFNHDFSTPTDTKPISELSVPVAPIKRTSRSFNTFMNETTTTNLLASSSTSNGTNSHAPATSGPSNRRLVRAVAPKRNGLLRPTSQLPQLFAQSKLSIPDKQVSGSSSLLSTTAIPDISHIYNVITNACVHFYSFRCRQAIECLNSLPVKQINTPYVLSKLGRAAFELVDYKEAETYFAKLRQQDRARIQDMEYYSTLLWHLRKENELSFLARELLSVDKECFQSWCALGNSFSLHKEAENALKCFQRAIYLNPESPYPYTLQAHEYIASEALESAQSSFRLAIRANNRHYNAWYGLGMVFVRYGDLDKAEYHFSHALSINPTNVVLICCLGMVLEKKGRLTEALDQYKKACDIQPKSALSRYKKVRAMIYLKLYDAALVEFETLKRLAPDEASVHFLLGQLYKILDKRDLAIKHFTIALNLDPKGSHFIKDALESTSER
jgi:anaphase-promoting complex subunit 3